MPTEQESIELQCINAIRTLSIDMIQRANSGHPGLPLGAAPMAYVLWQRHLRHDPTNPTWPDRDRFVLSAGHGSAILYSLLHLTGHDLSIEDLRAFRQWGSRTPGHPELHVTPGVEATTGPLGQGTANAVGMAIAERALAHQFNRPGHTIVDHFTYALVSDGDLMEGISAEAASLAGHLKLGKLIYLYDANDVSLDGPTSLAFSTENVAERYEAYGWQTLTVENGNKDIQGIDAAIAKAKADTARPSIIIIKTTIGYGSPNKQGTSACHGSPLGAEEVALTKRALGCDPDQTFVVPDCVLKHFREGAERGHRERETWTRRVQAYEREHPTLATTWRLAQAGELPADWDGAMPSFAAGAGEATRQSSGKVLNAIAQRVPFFMGGDADLSTSTQTSIKGERSFEGQEGSGRNLHFGVREHAMAAIANGIAYHGGLRPFVSTFFAFVDYMRPPMRLAAMSKLPVIYVFTHDSAAVGEDGPTHQPVEQLASLRAMPGLTTIRPADANETVEAWRSAMQRRDGPTVLVLSRQKLPTLDRVKFAPASGVGRGAYVISEAKSGPPDAIVMATGSEVHVALEAQEDLDRMGIRVRVVSMPSWEEFRRQPAEYRESVLPAAIGARVSIEAGVGMGWSAWVGDSGIVIGIDRFGASAPGELVLDRLGINRSRVIEAVCTLVRGAAR